MSEAYRRLLERHARDEVVLNYYRNARHRQERAERERPALIAAAMAKLRAASKEVK